MTKKTILLSIILGLGFTIQTFAHGAGFRIMMSARMNGSQQVPAVSTNAVGVASLFLNASKDTLCLSLTSSGISGSIQSIHIHSGAMGVNGPVLLDLSPFVVGNTVKATLTGSNLTKTLLNAMLMGNTYINLHTVANPNGEIRGQIVQESDWLVTAKMDGMQQNPPVNTMAKGLAVFNLSKHLGKLSVKVVVDGLSGPIAAIHLHKAAVGADGPVVADLSSFISGNTVMAELDPASYISDLMAGNIYINLHTASNPNGEIRGQLMINNGITFDAWLDGAQQNPMVNTPAKGIMSLVLNGSFDTLTYMVQTNLLKSPASSAHLHLGSVGGNGGVAVDLTPGISGNTIMGKISGSSLDATIINSLLSGDIYINIHNDSNANGEIRGQVYPLLRKSFVVELDGGQQVPGVTTNAVGSGVLSLDRNNTDLHVMVVSSGLTISAIHFHKNVKGENGGVLYDLFPFLSNNGIFMYWKNTDASPLTMAAVTAFKKDSVYVNVHTVANPNGEIRGQVVHESYCYLNSTAVNEIDAVSFDVYPNPVQDHLYIDLLDNSSAQFNVYNSMGQIVMSSDISMNTDLNTSGLSSGIYILEIKTNSGRSTQTFIKN